MRSLLLFMALVVFWFLLSGEFDSPILVTAGLICCAFVTWLSARMGIPGPDQPPLRHDPGLPYQHKRCR